MVINDTVDERGMGRALGHCLLVLNQNQFCITKINLFLKN